MTLRRSDDVSSAYAHQGVWTGRNASKRSRLGTAIAKWPRTKPPRHPSIMRLTQLVHGHLSARRIIICALAGLLIFYHTYTLFDLYFGSGTDLYERGSGNTNPQFKHVQSILRVMIIFSLALVVMNRRFALYGMWAAISALVATHYWAFFLDLPFRFLDGRHPLSYLKGFVIPTVITLLYLPMNSQRNSRKSSARLSGPA